MGCGYSIYDYTDYDFSCTKCLLLNGCSHWSVKKTQRFEENHGKCNSCTYQSHCEVKCRKHNQVVFASRGQVKSGYSQQLLYTRYATPVGRVVPCPDCSKFPLIHSYEFVDVPDRNSPTYHQERRSTSQGWLLMDKLVTKKDHVSECENCRLHDGAPYKCTKPVYSINCHPEKFKYYGEQFCGFMRYKSNNGYITRTWQNTKGEISVLDTKKCLCCFIPAKPETY